MRDYHFYVDEVTRLCDIGVLNRIEQDSLQLEDDPEQGDILRTFNLKYSINHPDAHSPVEIVIFSIIYHDNRPHSFDITTIERGPPKPYIRNDPLDFDFPSFLFQPGQKYWSLRKYILGFFHQWLFLATTLPLTDRQRRFDSYIDSFLQEKHKRKELIYQFMLGLKRQNSENLTNKIGIGNALNIVKRIDDSKPLSWFETS